MATRQSADTPTAEEREKRSDDVFHQALDKILAFGKENGWEHPVVMNTINAICTGNLWIDKNRPKS
jgi:hypothetical protein